MTPPAATVQPLTARELRCLTGAAHGLTNAEICAALGLSHNVVGAALQGAYTKLGARTGVPQVTRTHAVWLARHLITAKEQPDA